MYLLCKIPGDLDTAATAVRRILNLPQENLPPSPPTQKRFGLNVGGGFYYQFEVLGMNLCLCKNEGEVAFKEEPEWSYYLWVHSAGEFASLISVIESRLKSAGVETQIKTEA